MAPAVSKILVVDDNPDDVAALGVVAEHLLPHVELEVVEGNDDAVAHVDASLSPALAVILDWNLPGGDATAVLDHIRRHPVWASVPVVVCSGDADPALADLVLRLGADAFEVKPAGVDGLASLLERVLALTSPEPV